MKWSDYALEATAICTVSLLLAASEGYYLSFYPLFDTKITGFWPLFIINLVFWGFLGRAIKAIKLYQKR